MFIPPSLSAFLSCEFLAKDIHHKDTEDTEFSLRILFFPHVDKNIHRAAANHPFFAGFIRRERKSMKSGFAITHRFARLGPDFGFDTAAADGACRLAVGKEKHLRAAALWCRATCVRDRGDDDTFAARVSVADQMIEVSLSDCTHGNQ